MNKIVNIRNHKLNIEDKQIFIFINNDKLLFMII